MEEMQRTINLRAGSHSKLIAIERDLIAKERLVSSLEKGLADSRAKVAGLEG